ncbi:hypothetical protein K450DRAFT_239030 [Umbelopsis ramanniana AG]|uniref:Secreted protein n=1 Tax=Umbelopsis ramanniana AG TaxID=1314678 RepID=A0AAD5EB11_UMBRA|nr:uncharacterized protein K450DRAFT_239030 [Umbelopsis ramanniana AG]KAI8580032.1 hypothetical protein K450DRAFT_239030 [Umbelopsis ramanniana AG]
MFLDSHLISPFVFFFFFPLCFSLCACPAFVDFGPIIVEGDRGTFPDMPTHPWSFCMKIEETRVNIMAICFSFHHFVVSSLPKSYVIKSPPPTCMY